MAEINLEATLYHGEALDVLRTLPTDSVGGCVTDPPYSSGGQFRGDRVGPSSASSKYIKDADTKYEHDFAGDTRDQRSWLVWCSVWLEEVRRVVVPGGVLACFVDWRQLPTLTDAVQCAGWTWRGIIPWDKTEGTRPQPGRPRGQAEYLVVGDNLEHLEGDDYEQAARAARDAIVWASKGAMDPERDAPVMRGVMRYPVSRNKRHPTEKPIPLLREVMQIVERGARVLDPFMGSGSHGAAALLNGHPFTGIEMSDAYVAIAREFIEEEIRAAGLSVAQLRSLEARGARVGGPVQVGLFDS